MMYIVGVEDVLWRNVMLWWPGIPVTGHIININIRLLKSTAGRRPKQHETNTMNRSMQELSCH